MPVLKRAHRGNYELRTAMRTVTACGHGRPDVCLPTSSDSSKPSLSQSNKTHALLRVRIPDCLAQQLAHREDRELVEPSFRRDEMVSVTTTSLIGEPLSRSTAGPLSSACVAQT